MRTLVTETPSGKILTIEEVHEARFHLEIIGIGLNETVGGQQGSKRCRPLGVTEFVWVQKIGKFGFLSISLGIGKEQPCVQYGNLRITLNGGKVELIDLLDLINGSPLARRTRKGVAENNRHLGVMFLEGGNDEFEVAGNYFGGGLFLKVVGTDE